MQVIRAKSWQLTHVSRLAGTTTSTAQPCRFIQFWQVVSRCPQILFGSPGRCFTIDSFELSADTKIRYLSNGLR